MPELPEVETIVRKLRPKVVGRFFDSIAVLQTKSLLGDAASVLHSPISSVERKAKIIIWRFANNHYMLTHLKMTGQLIWVHNDQKVGGGHPTADWVRKLPSSHTRIIFSLSDGATLFFNDQRVFGWCKMCNQEKMDREFSHTALDITDPNLTPQVFFQRLQKKSVAIKQVVLDSSIVAGIGNIYACDGLFVAGISPTRSARSLTKDESDRLFLALRQVINQGIELGGATISDYADVDGFSGKYQDVRRVYKREEEPCLLCQQPIRRIRQGGRSTFFCPNCQK